MTNPISTTYDSSKRYDALLFRPDRTLLPEELNELQDIVQETVGRLGAQVFPEGRRLTGGEISVSGTTAMLGEGIVFAQGQPRLVPAATLTVPTSGPAEIGVLVHMDDVTIVEDPTLANPYDGAPVAERRRVTISWQVNHPEAVNVYRLLDGTLFDDAPPPTLSPMELAMARRTRNTSGDFLSEGLASAIEVNDATSVYVVTDPGTAYVSGNEIVKPIKTRNLLQTSRAHLTVLDEPNSYDPGQTLYPLINTPVRLVSQVTAVVEVQQTITRGNIAGTQDLLPLSPVSAIVEVKQGATTYTSADYQRTGNSVDWSLGGAEPSPGTTYTVKWCYNKQLTIGQRSKASTTLHPTRAASGLVDTVTQADSIRITAVKQGATTYVEGVDYTYAVTGSGYTLTWASAGSRPANSSTYDVDADHWAHTLEGDVLVYNSYDTPELVTASRRNGVDFSPSGASPVTDSVFYCDYDHYLQRRDIGYMDADGNISLHLGDPHPFQPLVPAAPRGTLPLFETHCPADSTAITLRNLDLARVTMADLRGFFKRFEDFVFNQGVLSLDQEAKQRAGASALRGYFTDNFKSRLKADTFHPAYSVSIHAGAGELQLAFTESNLAPVRSSGSTTRHGTVLESLPFTEVQAITQRKTTETVNINLHNNFDVPIPWLTLTPPRDIWADITNTYVDSWGSWWGEQTDVLVDEALPFMRQISINVQGENFAPNEDNIQLFFAGRPIAATPATSAYQGTTAGTLKANASGRILGAMTVPANTPTGTVTVTAKSPIGHESEPAPFVSEGRRQVMRTIFFRVASRDPLAQSFLFPSDRHITGIGVYFVAKATDGKRVRCEVRNMINGYPGPEVLAAKELDPSGVSLTGETKFIFDNPVPVDANTQYCFALVTDSAQYVVNTATLGKWDPTPTTGGYVTSNAYTIGDMFTSANALTWVAYPNTDLKFAIYCAKYSANAHMLFENLTGQEAASVLLAVAQLTPLGTRLDWSYSVDGGATFLAFGPWTMFNLQGMQTQLQLKATLSTTNENVSPLIEHTPQLLVARRYNLSGSYIGKQLPLTVSPDDATVYVEMATPSGTTQTPSVSLDDGVTWHPMVLQSSAPVDSEFNLYTYTFDFAGNSVTGTQFRYKHAMTTIDRAKTPRARNLIANLS